MASEPTDHENARKPVGLPLVFFRTLYIATVALAVGANIFLLSHGKFSWSVYLLITASVIMSMLGVNIFSKLQGSTELKQFNDNLKESQRLIYEAENRALPFLARRNAMRLNNYSFSSVIEEPLNWVLGVFVFWIFFTTETYTKFDFNDPEKMMLLILISLLQLVMLSMAISGMAAAFYKKIKRKPV